MTLRVIPAIMSGGAGARLWPLSTEDHPKQFHALAGPRTLFAATVARVSGEADGVSFAPPIVLCGDKHVARVRAGLEEAGAEAAAIVIEPAARGTAAVAATTAAVAREIDRDALALLLPSDHIVNEAAFHAAVAKAGPFARDRIVTFGVAPTHAATGYGYIKSGAALGDGVFAIETFKEKPDEQTARRYLREGDHVWNSGMFLFAPDTLLAEFGANTAIRDQARAAFGSARRSGNEIRLGAEYAAAPALPLDIAVMEHTSRGAVLPCDIGWADIGSWAEVWRLAPRDSDGFALLGPAASADASKMQASGVKVAVLHGDDLVVVAAPTGLLIAPRAIARDREALKRVVRANSE
jgi:mannose-1-phosphate guanylyltransferase/mannose-6-phosphate isomerase